MESFGTIVMDERTPHRERIPAARLQRTTGTGRLVAGNTGGGTRIATLFQEGAAKLRFPATGGRHLEAVTVNTACGLTGGDRLNWDFLLEERGSLTVTTQACEKIYRASGESVAEVHSRIRVAAGAHFAWLPQETILFERSALRRELHVELAEGARLLLAEAVIFGRAAMGETISTASFSDRWRIRRRGRLIHGEDFAIGPNAGASLARKALLGGCRAMASIVLIDDDTEAKLDAARSVIDERGGASCFAGKLVARLIDRDAYSLRERLVPLLQLLNGSGAMPRVWSI